MEIAITISAIFSAIFFAYGLGIMLAATLSDSEDRVFNAGVIIVIISLISMVSFALCRNIVIKQNSPKEYSASEYTFKIKVVKFEEQRDTILVVIPKEK